MLASAVRRVAPVILSKNAEETREILSVMLERSPSVGVVQIPDQKLKSEVDTICKRRVKDEEKNLSWWLDQSDPYSLFRVPCYALHSNSRFMFVSFF